MLVSNIIGRKFSITGKGIEFIYTNATKGQFIPVPLVGKAVETNYGIGIELPVSYSDRGNVNYVWPLLSDEIEIFE